MITEAIYNYSTNGDRVSIVIVRDGQKLDVPIDEANRHYQEILEWVAEGNTITDNGGN